MVDETKTTVTVLTHPDGKGALIMSHPGGPVLASVVLTNEIVDYLMANLPQHHTLILTTVHGMTGPY